MGGMHGYARGKTKIACYKNYRREEPANHKAKTADLTHSPRSGQEVAATKAIPARQNDHRLDFFFLGLPPSLPLALEAACLTALLDFPPA